MIVQNCAEWIIHCAGVAPFANVDSVLAENGSQGRDAELPGLPGLREFGKLLHSVKMPLQVANCQQG